MDFLFWNATPAYKGNQPQPAQSTGLLTGLRSLLGGGGAPAYKSVGSTSAQAPASSSSWWPVLSAAPVYKTATPSAADAIDLSAPSPDNGDDDSDPTCVCDDQATQVVIL